MQSATKTFCTKLHQKMRRFNPWMGERERTRLPDACGLASIYGPDPYPLSMWYILGPKLLRKVSSSDGAKIRFKFKIPCSSGHETSSHHYQASIDFNTGNTHCMWGCNSWDSMATGMISNDMIFKNHIFQYTSLGVY